MRENPVWYLVLVEDNAAVRRQVREFLEGEEFPFGSLHLTEAPDFEGAQNLLREKKVDLLILDVRGEVEGNERAGIDVLESWRSAGFAPVIFYTALPELVSDLVNPLVRLVAKDSGGLSQLSHEINALFSLRIPQAHRAIVQHFDAAVRSYMWGFVIENWSKFEDLISQPDFVRLLLRRLAAHFASDGVASVVESVYPGAAGVEAVERGIHPTELYIKPPLSSDPQLGDLKILRDEESSEIYFVLWPSCDLIMRDGLCKVDRALCAKAEKLTSFEEYNEWLSDPAPGKERALKSLMSNNRKKGQAERYHFLPPAWDIPAVVVDFQQLRHVDVSELREAECLASVASPFAEAISVRFVRYLGRLGTPDLDLDLTLSAMKEKAAG